MLLKSRKGVLKNQESGGRKGEENRGGKDEGRETRKCVFVVVINAEYISGTNIYKLHFTWEINSHQCLCLSLAEQQQKY